MARNKQFIFLVSFFLLRRRRLVHTSNTANQEASPIATWQRVDFLQHPRILGRILAQRHVVQGSSTWWMNILSDAIIGTWQTWKRVDFVANSVDTLETVVENWCWNEVLFKLRASIVLLLFQPGFHGLLLFHHGLLIVSNGLPRASKIDAENGLEIGHVIYRWKGFLTLIPNRNRTCA